jgi:hypothetical protein
MDYTRAHYTGLFTGVVTIGTRDRLLVMALSFSFGDISFSIS